MKRLLTIGLIVVLASIGVFWVLTSPRLTAKTLSAMPAGEPDLANGKVVFFAGGCASCHATPGQDDKLKLGGGLALKTEFGTFHSPNLSPHPTDGIGAWTTEQFLTALWSGTSPSGEHYYPAFPYTTYRHMTASDGRDLFAYIKTLEPVAGRAPGHDLAFPFTLRRGLGLWKLAFMGDDARRPDLSRSASWNRGAYLVESLGHCAECHSPRNLAGGTIADRRYSGGPDPEGGDAWVPNITPHPDGLSGWSKGDVAELLSTGFTPEYDSVGGSMAAVVRNTSQLSAEDRAAIAEYILSLPPRAGKKP